MYNILNIYTTAYFNNILIYSENIKDYERYVNNILNRFIKIGLNVDIDKYEFYIIRIKYLSIIITFRSIKIDLNKVKVITE